MSPNENEKNKLSGDGIPDLSVVNNKIIKQIDKVKKLVNDKAEKSILDEADKILSQLKSEYKHLTGKDWSPQPSNQGQNPMPMNGNTSNINNVSDKAPQENLNINIKNLSQKIIEIGCNINKLKSENHNAETIKAQDNELLKLKAQYKEMTGHIWYSQEQSSTTSNKTSAENKQNPSVNKQSSEEMPNTKEEQTENIKTHNCRLGMEAKKEENFSEWYSQVITKSELIEYYDVSGCYILRPWSLVVWNIIKEYIDTEIQNLKVQNCYFPMFIPKSVLEKEKAQISNVSSEIAWVTKVGNNNLSEPIALRLTSETVIYPMFAKWLQSHRDLPLKLNQWNNVIRWEIKNPQPFIRTREFLWQEGHTAHAKQNEADDEVYTILDLYEKVYTDLLAVPVIKGRKTEKENLAGSDFTTTVEAFISTNGRCIQGATSQFLGQNFSKLYEIAYSNPETQKKEYVYQNSWSITTRTIGIMIMVHSDNKGLVLPPSVAMYQVVIIPCGVYKINKYNKDPLLIACEQAEKKLSKANIRVYADYRDNYSPGWKFNYWELKGVPVRLEIGRNELANNSITLIRRDSGSTINIAKNDVVFKVQTALKAIHRSLLQRASNDLRSHTALTTDWSEFIFKLNKKYILLSPFCGSASCEEKIRINSAKYESENDELKGPSIGAKGLCTPFKQPRPLKQEEKCIRPDCKNKPSAFTLFGRSY